MVEREKLVSIWDQLKQHSGLDEGALSKRRDQLKESAGIIGDELKRSGKVIARQVRKSVEGAARETDDAVDEVAHPYAGQDAPEKDAEHETLHAAPEALDESDREREADRSIEELERELDELRRARDEKRRAVGRKESHRGAASNPVGQKSKKRAWLEQLSPRRDQRRLTALILFGFGVLALALIIVACAGARTSGGTAPDDSTVATTSESCDATLHIACEKNLIFSTYDLNVSVDGNDQGVVKHGEIGTFDIQLEEGTHTLELSSADDADTTGSIDFSLAADGDSQLYFEAKCTSSQVEIEPASKDDVERRHAESLAETYLMLANKPGTVASDVIAALEEAGYEDEGFTLVCMDGESELEEFDPATYDVDHAETDAEEKTITLHLTSNVALEASFDQETALRAAVVAMTNCYAMDVFSDDGISYDPNRFHSYADMSGYYLTVEDPGAWEVKDASTWHVDALRLKVAGNELRIELTADVSFDGTNYVISSGTASVANSFEAIEQHDGSVSVDTMEPRDTAPYLTVPPTLIADARDAAAEDAARAAEDAAQREQETYDSWISSQFSFWDGSNGSLVDQVKEMLNDERSFEHDETSYIPIRDEATLNEVNTAFSQDGTPVANMNDVVLFMKFTAKNGFNATMKREAYGLMHYPDGTVDVLAVV